MLQLPHPLDPNFMELVSEREHYIYGDDHGDYAARVDAEDYWFFSRWRWSVKFDRHGRKPYLYRKAWCAEGRNNNVSVFLHVAIFERTGIVRPSGHSMVDHKNGNSLECRRFNLRAATPSMNRRNIYGQGDLL